MAELVNLKALREQTERHISRRLRLSSWLRLGIVAVGVAAGVCAAYNQDVSTADSDSARRDNVTKELIFTLAGLMLASSAGATMYELASARKKCEDYVDSYWSASRASGRRSNVIRVRFAPGQRPDGWESEPDRNISRVKAAWELGGYYFAPFAAGFGTLCGLSPYISNETDYRILSTLLGAVLVLAAAVALLTIKPPYDEWKQYFRRELDKVDCGIV